MWIDLKVSVAGPGMALTAGIREVDEPTATMLIKAGHATPVEPTGQKRGRKRGATDDMGDGQSQAGTDGRPADRD